MSLISNLDDFAKYTKENDIKFVDFRFTDIEGAWHHIAKPIEDIDPEFFSRGIGFDGSSIKGWKSVHDSDMLLKPDVTTTFPCLFSSHAKLAIICDVVDTATGEGYEKDPRTIAKKTEAYFKSQNIGDKVFFGPELEFFVFDKADHNCSPYNSNYSLESSEVTGISPTSDDNRPLGYKQLPQGGYFPNEPVDHLDELRSEITRVMIDMGLEALLHHHEVAVAQSEIGIKYNTPLNTADNIQKYKYAAKNTAFSYGKSITFMPKPVAGSSGSGMHMHQSIWKDGKNTFIGNTEAGLSETALYYIGGIMKYAKAILAFTNPSTNSYKRLSPGFEAPVYLAYSKRNRSASIRIPHSVTENETRVEVRFPDPTANPYLAISALLHAGIAGIKEKIHPGDVCDHNLYTAPSDVLSKYEKLPTSLPESLKLLDENRSFLTSGGAFTDTFIDSFINNKRSQLRFLDTYPTPAEFQLYYMC